MAVSDELVVRGDIVTATFLLLNVTIGVGMLSMPFALKQAGFGFGVLIRILTYLIFGYTWVILIQAGHLANSFTYQGLMKTAFGRPGFALSTLFQFIFPFLLAVEQIIVLGDTASALVKLVVPTDKEDDFYARREFLSAAIIVILMLPLSLLRDITKLASWSLLSVVTVVFVVVIVAIRFATLDLPPTADAYAFFGDDVLTGLGTFSHTMISHYSSLIIYNSIKNKSEAKWIYVAQVSLTIAGFLYLSVAILGYATFTENILPDLANNYCKSDILISVGRLTIIILLALTYPVQLFAMRQAIELSVFRNHQPVPLYRHVLLTLVIIAATYGITLLTNCLDFVTSLNGSIAGISIALLLPASAFMRLKRIHKKIPIWSRENTFPLLVMLFGLFCLVSGIVDSILSMLDGLKCSELEEPAYCSAGNDPGVSTTVGP